MLRLDDNATTTTNDQGTFPAPRATAPRRSLRHAALLLARAAAPWAPRRTPRAQAVDRLVVQGFEDPQGADAGLHALQAATPATPDNTRALLVGFGMVAADNHLADETAAAAKALRELAATAGPIAEADAHLVNADLEFEGMQEENGNVEARAAVAGYSPYLRVQGRRAWPRSATASTGSTRCCSPATARTASATPAPRRSTCTWRSTPRCRPATAALEIKATAILASLAQGDNDAELAERLLARAQALAKRGGRPGAAAPTSHSFEGDVLASREQYAASRAAYRDGHRDLARRRPAAARGAVRDQPQRRRAAPGPSGRVRSPRSIAPAVPGHAQRARPGAPAPARPDASRCWRWAAPPRPRSSCARSLARYDRETGPNARIGVLRDLGPALARAGDRAGALELYTREQQLLQAKNDSRYERDMQDVQKLIKAERRQAAGAPRRRMGRARPSPASLLALAIAFVARRQTARNRQLASRNDALLHAGRARPADRPGQPRAPAGARGRHAPASCSRARCS